MKLLPDTEQALLLRTEFTDDAAWGALRDAVENPTLDGFRACVDFHVDPNGVFRGFPRP